MNDDEFMESLIARVDSFVEAAKPELTKIAQAYLMREAAADQQAALQEQPERCCPDVMFRGEADGDGPLCGCEMHGEDTQPRLAVLSGKEDVTQAWALEPVKDEPEQPARRQRGRKLLPVIGSVALLAAIAVGGVALVDYQGTDPAPVVIGNAAPAVKAPAPVTIPPITVVATQTPMAVTKTVVQPPVTVTATMPVIVTVDPFGLPN
jgi:hypothetical protein